MQVTNLNISDEESQVLSDQKFFLLKDSATKKIVELFGELEKEYKKMFEATQLSKEGLSFQSGKIFRGENYRLFPYIVLDYPRLFSSNSIFAFRTMIWWGHEFSFTLHLQGEALNNYRSVINKNSEMLDKKDLYYCVNDTPWQYHFGMDNYLPIDIVSLREDVMDKPFIKISKRLPIKEHRNIFPEAIDAFALFIKLLS